MMSGQRGDNRFPVIDGWFEMGVSEPHLLANRCKACGDYFFPKAAHCRNPGCRSVDLHEVPLSRKGKLWSYTIHYYEPPPPFVPSKPFVPYAIAVVELHEEGLMVLGQVKEGLDVKTLHVGMDMELVVEKLYADDDGGEHVIWKWQPCQA